MKNIYPIVVLSLALLATACTRDTNGPTKSKRTVITGHIKNLEVFPNEKQIIVQVVDFGGAPSKYAGVIHKDGSFTIRFNQIITEDIKLTQEFRTTPIIDAFIAHPGDSIHVELDYKSINDVKFSGDAQKTNTDIYEYNTKYYSYGNIPAQNYPLPMLASYKIDMDIVKAAMEKNRIEFIDKVQANDEVKTWTKNYVNLTYYNSLGSFLQKYNAINYRDNESPPMSDNMESNKTKVYDLKDIVNVDKDLEHV